LSYGNYFITNLLAEANFMAFATATVRAVRTNRWFSLDRGST